MFGATSATIRSWYSLSTVPPTACTAATAAARGPRLSTSTRMRESPTTERSRARATSIAFALIRPLAALDTSDSAPSILSFCCACVSAALALPPDALSLTIWPRCSRLSTRLSLAARALPTPPTRGRSSTPTTTATTTDHRPRRVPMSAPTPRASLRIAMAHHGRVGGPLSIRCRKTNTPRCDCLRSDGRTPTLRRPFAPPQSAQSHREPPWAKGRGATVRSGTGWRGGRHGAPPVSGPLSGKKPEPLEGAAEDHLGGNGEPVLQDGRVDRTEVDGV